MRPTHLLKKSSSALIHRQQNAPTRPPKHRVEPAPDDPAQTQHPRTPSSPAGCEAVGGPVRIEHQPYRWSSRSTSGRTVNGRADQTARLAVDFTRAPVDRPRHRWRTRTTLHREATASDGPHQLVTAGSDAGVPDRTTGVVAGGRTVVENGGAPTEISFTASRRSVNSQDDSCRPAAASPPASPGVRPHGIRQNALRNGGIYTPGRHRDTPASTGALRDSPPPPVRGGARSMRPSCRHCSPTPSGLARRYSARRRGVLAVAPRPTQV